MFFQLGVGCSVLIRDISECVHNFTKKKINILFTHLYCLNPKGGSMLKIHYDNQVEEIGTKESNWGVFNKQKCVSGSCTVVKETLEFYVASPSNQGQKGNLVS